MNYKIKSPETALKAVVQLPSSKSICNRALILNALSYSPYPCLLYTSDAADE